MLDAYRTLEVGTEQEFRDLAELAAAVCRAPMGFVTLISRDQQVFKACAGMQGDVMPRDVSFCTHAILTPDAVLEVPDTACDVRFATNPLVTGPPGIRFYAGAPLIAPSGVALGTVCVVDQQPRNLTDAERRALKSLARQAVTQLELRRAVEALKSLGRTDGLTGIGNRRAFDQNFRDLWLAHVQDHSPLALLMLDIDHFKRINDAYGHIAGDEVLVQMARLLRIYVGQLDVVTRFGGEEFAVLLPGADLLAGRAVAERLRSALHGAKWPSGGVTASIGLSATHPSREDEPAALLARADRALYQAKQSGRDRICTFNGWK